MKRFLCFELKAEHFKKSSWMNRNCPIYKGLIAEKLGTDIMVGDCYVTIDGVTYDLSIRNRSGHTTYGFYLDEYRWLKFFCRFGYKPNLLVMLDESYEFGDARE